MQSHPRRYARRRLAPFRGLTEVVEAPVGRASSTDGHNWRLEIRIEEEESGRIEYLWYGVWSPSEGLARMRRAPWMDPTLLEEAGGELQAEAEHVLGEIPLPLEDCFERWLLDDEGYPLALLSSTDREEEIDDYRERRWRAIREEDVSNPLIDDPARHSQQQSATIDPDHMERLIRQRSGPSAVTQWFRRNANGEGVALPYRAPAKWARRTLTPKRFPKFLIDHHWRDREALEMVERYVAWNAPYLLSLPHFSERTRERLERDASTNALAVADNWRLYPKVVNEKAITAARVEARMRRAL